jgi:hypothetical protein
MKLSALTTEPHLILHLVRGEPEFGVAVPLERGTETWWVICSSGHRAWPFKKWPLSDLADTSDINYAGRHNRPIDFLDTIPADWPDHYGAAKSWIKQKVAEIDLEVLGLDL